MNVNKTENFIKKAKLVHGDKYDYSKVDYVNSKEKVCIICPEHGEFWQTPANHVICKQGCPKCGKKYNKANKRIDTYTFVTKSKEIHGRKYDYSKVNYVNNRTKVCIICPEHGEFWQIPYSHTKGFGCPKCGGKSKVSGKEFVERSIKIHGNKYSYNKVKYINTDKKVIVTCLKHGDFLITPHHHLNGVGCPKCAGNASYNNCEIVSMFKNVHGDTYDYSMVNYINTNTKVDIICKKHGVFRQTPKAHLNGQGCHVCGRGYTKSENKLFLKLKEHFPDATLHHHPIFLKTYKNGWQELDIFIPSLNVAVEYQGKQHFEPVSIFGGEDGYNRTIKLDSSKHEKCLINNVKLFYFTYEKTVPKEYYSKIYTDELDLIKSIKNVTL